LTSENNLKKILIYSIPGISSILISTLSILFFLKYFPSIKYANFILQHLFLTIGQGVFSLGLGRIASIKIQNLNRGNKKKIISTTIYTSFFLGIILSVLICLFFIFFIKKYSIFEITLSLLFGLIFSCIYQTCEDIGKGLGYVKVCSVSNIFFFNISISLPAFLMFIQPTNAIIIDYAFEVSVIVKFLTLFFFIKFLFKKKIISFKDIELKKIKNFFYPSIWFTIYAIFHQILYSLDKYFIKISLGASQLILFSLPQQLSQKLGILSQAVCSVILPKLSKNINNKDEILTANIYGVFYFLSIVLIIAIPFLEYVLYFFLENKYNYTITIIFKFFLLISFYNCISEIIINFYHAELQIKRDVKYITFSIVPFIIGLIICTKTKEILTFVILILIKDLILLIWRILSAKKFVKNFQLLIFQIIIFNILYINEIYKNYVSYFVFVILFLFFLIKNSNKDLILNYFSNSMK